MEGEPVVDISTNQITTWRSIVTLIVFIITSERQKTLHNILGCN